MNPVLVTGGAGYIGSHIALSLLDAGHHVVILDNMSTGFRELIPAESVFIQADIRSTNTVRNVIQQFGIRDVVHCAASLIVPESLERPLFYWDNNVVASHALLGVCAAAGIERFLFSSTAAVYGEGNGSTPASEETPTAPVSPYGRSKRAIEWMLEDVGRATGMRTGILRYFNVAGADPGGRSGQMMDNATHLVKVACEAALGIRPGMAVFGRDYPTRDGTCVRDYIHVSDLADIHRLTLDLMASEDRSVLFNCGYGTGFTVQEIIDAVRSVSGRDFLVEDAPRRDGDPAAIVADTSALRRALRWTPRHQSIGDIVASVLKWEQLRLENGETGR